MTKNVVIQLSHVRTLYRAVEAHLSANQQLKGVVDGRAFVKQQRFEFHLLHLIKRIKNYRQELRGDRNDNKTFLITVACVTRQFLKA